MVIIRSWHRAVLGGVLWKWNGGRDGKSTLHHYAKNMAGSGDEVDDLLKVLSGGINPEMQSDKCRKNKILH